MEKEKGKWSVTGNDTINSRNRYVSSSMFLSIEDLEDFKSVT